MFRLERVIVRLWLERYVYKVNAPILESQKVYNVYTSLYAIVYLGLGYDTVQ
jgi:hypothetical protein